MMAFISRRPIWIKMSSEARSARSISAVCWVRFSHRSAASMLQTFVKAADRRRKRIAAGDLAPETQYFELRRGRGADAGDLFLDALVLDGVQDRDRGRNIATPPIGNRVIMRVPAVPSPLARSPSSRGRSFCAASISRRSSAAMPRRTRRFFISPWATVFSRRFSFSQAISLRKSVLGGQKLEYRVSRPGVIGL